MEAISYSYADKANKKINKFINDPDSTSGVITVPTTIAAGETITIPAGRIAVLPNVQVDGTLTVLGDVFIPTGSTMSQVISRVTSTDNAVIRFDGTTGAVQNSGVIIDDNGNVGIGTSSPDCSLEVVGNDTTVKISNNNTGLTTTALQIGGYSGSSSGLYGTILRSIHNFGVSAASSLAFELAGYEKMRIDSAGNLLVGTTTAGAPSSGCTFDPIGATQIAHPAGTASGTVYSYFLYNGGIAGSILQSGTTAVTYNTTSDYRLKENIRPSDCKRFMDIKFVDYERIDGRHECGVIAHELQEVYPDLVTGKKDAVEIRKVELTPTIEEVKNEEGNVITEAVEATYEDQEFPVYQQVNYIGLIARIGTVVQQQAKLIEAMQLEINELKGAK